MLSNNIVTGKKAVEYFADKFDDPMMFAQVERCASVPTDTILFNIDSKSPINKDTSMLTDDIATDDIQDNKLEVEAKGRLFIAERHIDEPLIICKDNKTISNLNFSLNFTALKYNETQTDTVDAFVYFVNEEYEELCPLQEIHLSVGENTKVAFSLNASASSLERCLLVIKSTKDSINEAQQITKFNVSIAFSVEFDF